MEIKRAQFKAVLKSRLKDYPAVCMVGPRQVGKTTLAKELKGQYFDLENEQDWNKVDFEWDKLISSKSLIIFDEAQTRPELFKRLRGAIDEDRKKNGRFLLLGSVSPRLLQSISESLTGRISYLELSPFSIHEIGPKHWQDLWFYGGFPDGGILKKKQFYQWQKDYLENIASRDLPELGLSTRPSTILRFFKLISSIHGCQWNASMIAKSLGISYHTVNNYVDLLQQVFLIRFLPSYHPSNFKKRLIKSPKIYWRDTGLLHFLHGFQSMEELQNDALLGLSFEGFVIEQILNCLNENGISHEAFSFRTSHGEECDLITKIGKKIYLFEVKLTSNPSNIDLKKIEKIADWIKPTKSFVVCNSSKEMMNDRLHVGTLEKTLKELI